MTRDRRTSCARHRTWARCSIFRHTTPTGYLTRPCLKAKAICFSVKRDFFAAQPLVRTLSAAESLVMLAQDSGCGSRLGCAVSLNTTRPQEKQPSPTRCTDTSVQLLGRKGYGIPTAAFPIDPFHFAVYEFLLAIVCIRRRDQSLADMERWLTILAASAIQHIALKFQASGLGYGISLICYQADRTRIVPWFLNIRVLPWHQAAYVLSSSDLLDISPTSQDPLALA